MRLFFITISLILLFSCTKDCDKATYYSFNDNELSFLLLKDSAVSINPMSFDYYNHNTKYLLNSIDTIIAGLETFVYQEKYDAYKCPKYMIEGDFSLNFGLNNFHNTISIHLIKNDSYCNDKLYKSIKIKSCEEDDYDCVQYRAKCFESECCDNDANYIIDSVTFNNQKYKAYIFSFEQDYCEIKEVVFIQNIGFVKISDFDNNEMILIKGADNTI